MHYIQRPFTGELTEGNLTDESSPPSNSHSLSIQAYLFSHVDYNLPSQIERCICHNVFVYQRFTISGRKDEREKKIEKSEIMFLLDCISLSSVW